MPGDNILSPQAILSCGSFSKKWIHIKDQTEFWEYWVKIKALAPASVIQYFKTYWLQGDNIQLWSAVYQKERTVFQECNTNMLVEAWHHLLKGTFMEGKRNRCLDHLIHILIDRAIPYFIQRHWCQEFGFEEGDLEVEERLNIERQSKTIKIEDINALPEEEKVYLVKSQSKSDIKYRVDLEAYDCSCLSFPTICFCKHICAVQTHFQEACLLIPTSSLTILCLDSFDPNPVPSAIAE
jgi:hypothetical protein